MLTFFTQGDLVECIEPGFLNGAKCRILELDHAGMTLAAISSLPEAVSEGDVFFIPYNSLMLKMNCESNEGGSDNNDN